MRRWGPWLALVIGVWGLGQGARAVAAPPAIEHTEPTSGPPGSLVSIVGRRFAPGAEVWLGDQPVSVERVLPSRISVRVPEGAASARITVRCGKEVARGPEFRVTAPPPAPVIRSIAPADARAGAEIVVRGEHFSPRLTGNLVDIAGVPAVVRNASPVALTVIVPEGAQSGLVHVRVPGAGDANSPAELSLLPSTRVEAIAPLRAGPGAELIVSGAGFSDDPKRNHVFIANTRAKVVAASAKELRVLVPERVRSGRVLVDVAGAGRATSAAPFVVQAAPSITRIEPAHARPGTTVSVYGADFGDDVTAVTATVAGQSVQVVSVAPTKVLLQLPNDARSGPLALTVNGVGPATSETGLTVLPVLALKRIAPRSAPVGATVTLSGTGFDDVGAVQRRVTIGGVEAEVISEAPGQLRVRVPEASSGRVRVSVAGQSVFSQDPFVITRPPRITGISSERVEATGELTIAGAGFGDNAKVLQVMIGGEAATVLEASDTQLRIRVGRKPATGKVSVLLPLQGQAQSAGTVVVLAQLRVQGARPERAHAGERVAVLGEGFVPGETRVQIAGALLTPSTVAADRLEFTLPDGAQTGELQVVLSDGRSAKAHKPFVVTEAPAAPAPVPAAHP